MSERLNHVYEFGSFSLDANKRLLLRAGEPLPLAPKVLETLIALVENRGRVLSKDELLKQVWGDTIVEEGGLTRNISVLRKALGERPRLSFCRRGAGKTGRHRRGAASSAAFRRQRPANRSTFCLAMADTCRNFPARDRVTGFHVHAEPRNGCYASGH